MTTKAAHQPGVAILAAIVNFISAAILFCGSAGFAIVSVLSAFTGWGVALEERWNASVITSSVGVGVAVAAGILSFFLLVLGAFCIIHGMGLLKAKKSCWFIQVVLSILFLIQFPIGTILNGAILIYLFRNNARMYYGI